MLMLLRLRMKKNCVVQILFFNNVKDFKNLQVIHTQAEIEKKKNMVLFCSNFLISKYSQVHVCLHQCTCVPVRSVLIISIM